MSRLHELLKPLLNVRWPIKSALHVLPEDGEVIVVKEPLIIDFGEFTDGAGNYYDSRGEGPIIVAHGITVVPDPHVDWTGMAVVEVCGSASNLIGIRIDTRNHQKPPAFGIVYGSVKRKDGTGHSYHGGQAKLDQVTCIGSFTVAGVGFINGEMVKMDSCNIVNENKHGGSAVYLGHGSKKTLNLRSRITLEGYTQTRVTITDCRLRSSGSAPLIEGEGNIGQVTVSNNILQSDSGTVFKHTGAPAEHVVFLDNRWESWFGSYFSSFEKAPRNCLIDGNYMARHGQLQPTYALVVCPEDIKAANIRMSRNSAKKPITNTRKTFPLEVTVPA